MSDIAVTPARPASWSGYSSPRGLETDGLPWRLWEKAKRLMWDPADLDLSRDAEQWAALDDRMQMRLGWMADGFMVGEEAVTLDILPLLRAISDEGRLEETMYLTTFAFEEAKHVDFFRRWFDAIGCDPMSLSAGSDGRGYGNRSILDDEMPRVMRRLDGDRSPRAVLDAAVTYNQFIEGVLAIAGYHFWDRAFQRLGILSGLQQGLQLVQRDERRHIAYGTYLCRRIIAEHPDLWDFAARRMEELTAMTVPASIDEDAPFARYYEFVSAQIPRRVQAMAAGRNQRLEDIERATEEELAPDLGPVPA